MKGYIAQQIPGHPARLACIRYTGALLAVAVGVLLAIWLHPLLDASVVLLVAILVAAWYSGFWPALLASLLATLALDYFFTPPLYTLTTEIAHIPRLLVFTLFSAMFVGISAARRRAERSLMQARDTLDATVRERTADLTRANQRLSTQYAVTRTLADSDSLDAALPEVLQIIGTAMHWDWGALWKVDRDAQVLRCATLWRIPGILAEGRADDRHLAFGLGRGLPGQVWHSGQARWIADVAQEPGFLRAESVAAAGLHAATAFPILIGDDTIGVLELFSRAVREPNPGELETLSALGSQIGQFVERWRAEEEREQTLVREQAAHAEAAASQQRFRELVDSIEGIVWEADAQTFQLTFVSKQAERMLGYPVRQWLDEATFWQDHIHTEDRESAVNLTVTATAQKRDHDFEYRMIASDGRVVWLRALVSVLVENDQATRLRGVTLDITARKQAEQALREQANLLNLTHDTIFVRDMNDVIRYWNRGAEELYGWKGDEAVGRVSHDLMRTMFPAPLEQITGALLHEGRWEGELVHTRRDGSRVVVASRWSLQRDARGRPVAILETNNDITERKQAENELRRSEAGLAEAQRVSHMGSWVHNFVDGTFTASPELLRIHGYTENEPIHEVLHRRIHPDDRDRIDNEIARSLHEKRDFEFEHRIVLPNGSIRHVHALGHPITNASGQLVEVLGTLADVTERKRAEDALRASEEQWRDVFEHNPTMYFMVDEAGTVLAVNPFGAEMLGYRVDELVGQPLLGVFPESEREAVQGNVAACLAELGRTQSWEARKVRKNGTALWARETAKAVPRANGPIVLIACEDITEQKRAAEALRQAQADLAHVSRVTTLGEMAASIAHEVDQPLSGVLINANACLRFLGRATPNLDEVRDGLQAIARDGRRASDVIGRIRLLARRTTVEKQPLDINGVIREVTALVEGEATRARARIRTELAGDLPRVTGDAVQLQQVVLNLLLNGLDAMQAVVDRRRELVIRTQREGTDGVHVAVQDSGIGLDPQVAQRIFEAFYSTKPHGMGMGLSISRSIVEQHGGRLWAVSNEGSGTTFHFTL